jgi:hypothetical protein
MSAPANACAFAPLLSLALLAFPDSALAVPTYARQTGFPCSQCHTLSFGPALTAYGRQFKLNGYTFGAGEHPLPLALMMQGGFSRSATPQPAPPVPHSASNDNLSIDQVSLFLATRLSDHIGMFAQATYSGDARHFNWDNTDIRYARPLSFLGTEAVVGLSVNNNPTVQDLWNSTPAWAYPYISSPLVPHGRTGPVISGTLAQLVIGATAYTLIDEHVYLEAGAYRGLSDRRLGNLGLYPANNAHVQGGAPYWRAAWQVTADDHYFSFGSFGLDVTMQPDPAAPATNRYTDAALDVTYQYTPKGPGAIVVNASLIHERQRLGASFSSGAADNPSNHLDALEIDASFIWRQTWSAGVGLFDLSGGRDLVLYAPAPLSGSFAGSPDTRGATLQLEYVPFGKIDSWLRPWVNVRIGLQYTAYARFNGGTANYDGFGRSASGNDSLFLFAWLAF